MSGRALLAAVALAALVGLVAATEPFDGGYNCKYLNIRQIRESALANDPDLDADDINAILKVAATTNNYFCKSCDTKRMQEPQNPKGVVLEGYGQCFCKEDYGWYFESEEMDNGMLKYKNWYGCTKCPDGYGTDGEPTTGPYRAGRLLTGDFTIDEGTFKVAALNRWTNTVCELKDIKALDGVAANNGTAAVVTARPRRAVRVNGTAAAPRAPVAAPFSRAGVMAPHAKGQEGGRGGKQGGKKEVEANGKKVPRY